jgi:hypothetical protein
MHKQIILSIVLLFISILSFSQSWEDVTIKTPHDDNVSAKRLISGELTSQQKTDIKNQWLNYYNNRIEYRGEATRTYNCHSYAWHVSEGGTYVWINTPNDDIYWTKGSYQRVYTETDNLKVSFGNCGKNVLVSYDYYGNPVYQWVDECDHSAVTTSTNGYFVSKWGPAPLFYHHKNDCPYSQESGLRYYKHYEPSCNSYYENITVTTNTTQSSSCKMKVKNVNVQNNSTLTIDAYTEINGPFEIQSGSVLIIQ